MTTCARCTCALAIEKHVFSSLQSVAAMAALRASLPDMSFVTDEPSVAAMAALQASFPDISVVTDHDQPSPDCTGRSYRMMAVQSCMASPTASSASNTSRQAA